MDPNLMGAPGFNFDVQEANMRPLFFYREKRDGFSSFFACIHIALIAVRYFIFSLAHTDG